MTAFLSSSSQKSVLSKKNPLEESLSKLNLQSTLVLLSILSTRALGLQQDEAKKNNISKLMKPQTAIKLPKDTHVIQ